MSDDLRGTYQDVGDANVIPPKWVIKNLLPVGLTVVGASPKAGKTTWTMIFAALLAGWECKAIPQHLRGVDREGPSLILSAEASAGELRDTLETGIRVKPVADGSILIAEDELEFQLDTPKGCKTLLHDLQELDPRLCILDPFRRFHKLEERDSAAVDQLVSPLRRWARENDAAFVIVHHTSKPPASERKDWIMRPDDLRGSGALFAAADGILMLTSHGSPLDVTVSATFKRGQPWDARINLAAWNSPLVEGREALGDLDRQVLRAIKNGITSKTIQAQLKIPSQSLVTIVAKLRRCKEIK